MKRRADHRRQSGNVFFALFGAVALVGAVGASTMSIMKGPVRSMHNVTQRTIAENAMIAAGKLTIMAASQPGGDCDGDNVVEPPGFVPGGTAPHPHGGGLLPSSVGAAKQDPWGNEFGYCVWDHGDAVKSGACADDASRLSGRQDGVGVVVAVISSGPDRIFQTSCNDEGAGDYVDKPSGSDDVIMTYTYDEAVATAGGAGLWTPIGADAAEIQRSLEVKADDGSGPVFAVDNSAGGPSIKVDFIQQLSAGAVEFLSGIRGTDASLSGNLDVTGAATLGNTDIAGDLSATGAATFGTADVAGSLEVGGSTTLESLTAGATSVGSLAASGIATLNSLAVTTNAQVGGTLTASGHTTLDTVETAGLASLESLSVTNEVGIGGALDVVGASTLTSLLTSGGITVGDDLSVTGDTNVATLTASGLATLDTLGVTNGASIGGQLNMTGGNIANLADPTNAADAATKSYVDAQVAAGTGFVEQDPTIVDIEDGKWCVGVGGEITCTAEPPIGDGDTLAGLECADGEVPKQVAGVWSCAPDRNDGTEQSCLEGGVSWTAHIVEDNAWASVAYGAGQFVAVGQYGSNRAMTSPDGVAWSARNTPAAAWMDVAYGNGLFVAVASSGSIRAMTSPDGVDWSPQAPPTSAPWRQVTFGAGLFVAVATSGTDRAMTSADGVTWVTRNTPSSVWMDVAYGNGMFVAVAKSGTDQIMTSPDGVTWTGRSAPLANLRSITYGGDRFVAVGSTGVMSSPDGITWTEQQEIATGGTWQSVTYGGGLFVAVSEDGSDQIMTSPDGVIWTARSAAAQSTWMAIAHGAGRYVAVGTTGSHRVMTAPAGGCTGGGLEALTCGDSEILKFNGSSEEWECATDAGDTLTGLTCAAAEIAKWDGSAWTCATDRNDGTEQSCIEGATDWTAASAPEANAWRGVTYANGKFVAVASSGTNRVMHSTDGITWTAATAAEANSWYSVTYGNGKFVAVASSGTNRVMHSTDGITWTAATAAEANSWVSVAYGNGRFVAVAESGANRIMHSTDGINWTATAAPGNSGWWNITYGGGKFVAVALGGTDGAMYSTDGINWTAAGPANGWRDIAYGNGMYVAVASSGTNRVMRSTDGINWTVAAAAEANQWRSVAYGKGKFVAVAQDGTNRVMHSPDGVAWTTAPGAEDGSWFSVVYGNDKFVAVASSGTNRVMIADAGGCTGGGLEALTCGDGEILKFNGTAEAWECGPDAGGDDLGDHTAITALDLATNAIVNLADPTNAQDAATKAYVDGQVAAGTGFEEEDPQVGTLTNGRWCRSNGSQVLCDQTAPSGDNLGNHIATTTLRSDTDNTDDLGTSIIRWRDAYLSGSVNSNGIITKSTATAGYNEAILAINGNDPSSYPASNSGGTFINTQATGTRNSGVYAETITGIGVVGYQDNGDYDPSVPSAAGGYFVSDQPTGATYGVYGQSTSSSGRGVYGVASATSGMNYGVYGRSASSSGYGVYGQADSPTGYGVYSAGRMHSTGTLTVTSNIINDLPSSTYDVWIQGGTASSGDARNLAILGQSALDALYINYFSEYAGGTYIGGPVSIIGSGTLNVAGSVTAAAYYQSSDRNLKTDIETIADPFALLDRIEGKHFLWEDSGKGAYGVIAQDVAAVMPEAIGENDDGYMTVEYSQLIGPLIEAVKQLKSEIKELRADNDNLHAANDNLREEVHALKAGGD